MSPKINFSADNTNASDTLKLFVEAVPEDNYYILQSIIRSFGSNAYLYFGDVQKGLFYISDNLKEDFGFDSNLIENFPKQWNDRLSCDQWRGLFAEKIRQTLLFNSEYFEMYYQVTDVNNKVSWVYSHSYLRRDPVDSKILFVSGLIKRQDNQFIVDPVSNLPTGKRLLSHLNNSIQKHEKRTVVGFSLNKLSQINSTYGKIIGDKLIERVAAKLVQNFYGTVHFYRLVGSHYAGLITKSCKYSSDAIINEMQQIISSSYEAEGFTVDNPCSFAVLEYVDFSVCPHDFLENLNFLIKQSKHQAKTPLLDNAKNDLERYHIISDMQMALSRDVLNSMDHFRTVIQPVVSTVSEKIVGGELLLRWKYRGEDISPGIFIPMLEESHLIQTAGRWVIEQGINICTRIVKKIPDFTLSINISRKQLDDDSLLNFIPNTVRQAGLSGKNLVLEVTESCIDSEPLRIQKLIDHCGELGIKFALDDFGTGYSSMRVLMRYDLAIVKLDRTLIKEMTDSPKKYQFISSIVQACHQFDKKVVAEGVESFEDRNIVMNAKCDIIQGFYYYRPTEINDIIDKIYKL